METNPLRVLDCKICGPGLLDAPRMADHLCEPCSGHLAEVKGLLEALQVPYLEDHDLVRGLDYYSRTAFEYIAANLDAAQNAVGGGGRYDGLAESLGGRRAPGVGFALGVDRIILAADATPDTEVDLYLISEIGAAAALVAASTLRGEGIRTDLDTEGRSVEAQFKAASRSDAPVLAVLKAVGAPLDVRAGEERVDIGLDDLAGWVREKIR